MSSVLIDPFVQKLQSDYFQCFPTLTIGNNLWRIIPMDTVLLALERLCPDSTHLVNDATGSKIRQVLKGIGLYDDVRISDENYECYKILPKNSGLNFFFFFLLF